MKRILVGFLTLSSAFAGDMDIQKCTKKVFKAAKSLAALEIGTNLKVSESLQESLSTATKFTITVVNTKSPAQVVYSVNTIDISESLRCVINKVELK
jgi:hypothetical protein